MPLSKKKSAVFIGLLVLLAIPAVGAFTHVKILPQLLILALFSLSIGLHLSARGAPWGRHLLAPALFLILLLSPVVALVHLLLWISPPLTVDGHPVMAIAQVGIGTFAGGVAGLLINALTFFRLRGDLRLDHWVVYPVALGCAVLFILHRVLGLI